MTPDLQTGSPATDALASTSAPALAIDELTIAFGHGEGRRQVVNSISFTVGQGETVALVGESGSGKTVTGTAVLGLLPSSATVTGKIAVSGVDVTELAAPQLRAMRGVAMAMAFQEPMTALNPAFKVGWQVAEALRIHDRELSKEAARQRAGELLRLAGIPDPQRRLDRFPHELSGGLRQRVVIAMAIACDPQILVADEVTTALDVTVQAEILDLLRAIKQRLGMGILVITHNMGVVADIADRVVVMHDGDLVEQAPVAELFAHPRDPYTRTLLASVPRLAPHPAGARLLERDAATPPDPTRAPAGQTAPDGNPTPQTVLAFDHVTVEYGARTTNHIKAVDDVSFSIAAGEIVGMVGESGSGKSTIGRVSLGLVTPTSGTVELFGHQLRHSRGRGLKALRRRCAIVPQDPASSLNPRMTVAESVSEPLIINKVGSRSERDRRVVELLESVRLDPEYRLRYPHELSGGQRQRVSVARALALRPELVIADEPTSALDVSVQATVLDLLLDLQAGLGFACLFITHDLAVVSLVAERVAVMQSGRLVEIGERDTVLFSPAESYTQRLIAAAPVPDPDEQRVRRQERAALLGQAS